MSITPETQNPAYPPLGPSADVPAPRPRKGRGGAVAAGIVGAAAIAIVAGAVGGGVGYTIAKDTAPTAAGNTATTALTPVADTAAVGATSIVPGSIADIAQRVSPSVVQLNVTGDQGAGTGSGFIISSDGYILTNNHVAGIGNNGSIEVAFADGTTAKGTLVGASSDYDLAVVKVRKTGLPAITLGSSKGINVGDAVIAVGSPLGLQGTVTSGIVSALNRPVTAGGEGSGDTSFIDAIQTDAAINPGNSGGPLLNAAGAVIGINSAIASLGATGAGQPGSIGLGFAIPIDTAKRIANEIVSTGKATTPIIGVKLDNQYNGKGARIADVTSGGPAEAAGLEPGDVIIKVDGLTAVDATQAIVSIRAHAAGETVKLTIDRDGQSLVIPVTLTTAKG